MSLKEKLAAMKAASAAKLAPETLEIMKNATAGVKSSGILQRVIKVGVKAPDFVLQDAFGATVDSAELRRQGPLLLSLYRGVW